MNEKFWHQRWEKGEIAFHQSEVNPLLIKHFKQLNLVKGNRIFLPLCGKTRDIFWLLSNNFQIVGIELSELAVQQLFEDLKIEANIYKIAGIKCYRARNIDIFVGDIFNLSAKIVGSVNAVYDRAALVALPAITRNKYTNHLTTITNKAPQLLICYQYNQILMDGPPFSINIEELRRHYQTNYKLLHIESEKVNGRLRGKIAATQEVWILQ